MAERIEEFRSVLRSATEILRYAQNDSPELYSASRKTNSHARVFPRHPVHLFPDEFLRYTTADKNTARVLDHLRVPAEIACRLRRVKAGDIKVLPQDIFRVAPFAIPGRVLPRPAHGGNVA